MIFIKEVWIKNEYFELVVSERYIGSKIDKEITVNIPKNLATFHW